MEVGGGGWEQKDIFGSEILAKKDFFGSMKDAGIFLILYFSSAQINNNVSTIYSWHGIFWVCYIKNVSLTIFFIGYKI